MFFRFESSQKLDIQQKEMIIVTKTLVILVNKGCWSLEQTGEMEMDVGDKGRGREMKSFDTLQENQNFRKNLPQSNSTSENVNILLQLLGTYLRKKFIVSIFHKECKNLVVKIAIMYIGGVKKIFLFYAYWNVFIFCMYVR